MLLKVTAPPEDGKANAAVCKLLAKALGVPKSAVVVTRGESSRHKTVEVAALAHDDVVARLNVVVDPPL